MAVVDFHDQCRLPLSNRDNERDKINMKKASIIVATLITFFFGIGGILPALAKVRDTGAIPSAFVGSYTLGVFLVTLVGVSAVFYALQKRKAPLPN